MIWTKSYIVPKFTPTSVKCVIASYNNHVIIHFSNDGSLRPAVKAKIIAKKSCKKVKERLRTEVAFVSRGVQRRAMIHVMYDHLKMTYVSSAILTVKTGPIDAGKSLPLTWTGEHIENSPFWCFFSTFHRIESWSYKAEVIASNLGEKYLWCN